MTPGDEKLLDAVDSILESRVVEVETDMFGRQFEQLFVGTPFLSQNQIPEWYMGLRGNGIEDRRWMWGPIDGPETGFDCPRHCTCWVCSSGQEFAIDRQRLLREAYWVQRCMNWLVANIRESHRNAMSLLESWRLYAEGVEEISHGGFYMAARLAEFHIKPAAGASLVVPVFWTRQSWNKALGDK